MNFRLLALALLSVSLPAAIGQTLDPTRDSEYARVNYDRIIRSASELNENKARLQVGLLAVKSEIDIDLTVCDELKASIPRLRNEIDTLTDQIQLAQSLIASSSDPKEKSDLQTNLGRMMAICELQRANLKVSEASLVRFATDLRSLAAKSEQLRAALDSALREREVLEAERQTLSLRWIGSAPASLIQPLDQSDGTALKATLDSPKYLDELRRSLIIYRPAETVRILPLKPGQLWRLEGALAPPLVAVRINHVVHFYGGLPRSPEQTVAEKNAMSANQLQALTTDLKLKLQRLDAISDNIASMMKKLESLED